MENDSESLQKSYATTIPQKLFLKKARFNERLFHGGDKQYTSLKKMKFFREENKKYLFNLIKSVYPPQSDNNQTDHVLNNMFNSNFIIKRIKTDHSESPPSNRVQKRQMKSVSNKKTFTCVQNEQQRTINQGQCVDFKLRLN